MDKIYCFINGGSPGFLCVVALAEDGTGICSHLSSNIMYAKHDIGISSDWKHDLYKNHYPNGYELEWIDNEDIHTHEGLEIAFKRNNIKSEEQG
jgi:hypothetical protein